MWVKTLINNGADIQQETTCGDWGSPLAIALHEENYELVEILLQNGANVNHYSNDYDTTPLLCCASSERLFELATLLICYGADLDEQDREKNTPLHIAVEMKANSLIEVLIKNGTNTDIKKQ